MGLRVKQYGTLLFLLLLHTVVAFSQVKATYPVQVNSFLKPPYSLYLDDYCNTSQQKLLVTLLNRDLLQPEVEVKLHIKINAGNQVVMETIDYKPLPLFRLTPGEPASLTQSDLCPYFQKENLQISGNFSGRFPEGMLEICFTVFEARTGKQLSQTSCCRAWITLNRPPILSLPQNAQSFPFRDPQQFMFQWTPRHQGLTGVEYELVLKELHEKNIAPEAAFPYSQEVFRKTTHSTSYAYTVMDPPLLENTRYAWQVRAVARDGFDELNIFENGGYSEIYTFTIEPGCFPPTGAAFRQEGDHAVISFIPSQAGAVQVLSVGRADGQGSPHEIVARQDYGNLFDLEPGIEYACKVGTRCVDGTIVYGEEIRFTLEDWRKKLDATCGMQPNLSLDRSTLLEKLSVGDVFMAGDFPVTVTQMEGGANGVFSGTGWTRLPMFMDAKVAVNFNAIVLNAKRELIGGFVQTSYDINQGQIANLDDLTQGGVGTGKTVSGEIWSEMKAGFIIPDGATYTYDPETGKLTVTGTANPETGDPGEVLGEIDVPEADREKFKNDEPFTTVITDAAGNVQTLTGDGKGNPESGAGMTSTQTGTKQEGGKKDFNPEKLESKDVVVKFSKGTGYYAFDQWDEDYKNIMLINGKYYEMISGYNVPFKLLPPGKTDVVKYDLNVIKTGIRPSQIEFRTGAGYTLRNDTSSQTLTLTGGKPDDAQDVYALYKDEKGEYHTVGKLKVVSYAEKSFNVTLVPIKVGTTTYTTDVEAVRSKLKDIYGPLGISWNVTEDKPFEYSSADIDSDGSGLLSQYTSDMRVLNAAYKSSRGTDKNTVYLFVMNNAKVGKLNPEGEMPKGKQYGYLFTGNGKRIPWTVAHELAHGRFKLYHTYDGAYGGFEDILTDNLMHSGEHLAKWQWDAIFSTALLTNPFDADEDAMAVGGDIDPKEAILKKAQELTSEFGNVYAIIHGFSPPDDKKDKKSFEKKIDSKTLDLGQPIYIKGYYSEGKNIYTNVLFFKFSENNNQFGSKSADYDLRKELSLQLDISSDVPYLAVMMPEEGKSRDCTPFAGGLEGVASASINSDEYSAYYTAMLKAVEECTKEKSLLIFANGYRTVDFGDLVDRVEFPNTNNTIQPMDINSYWVGIDTKFKERLKSRNVAYVDGHHSISTSNHRLMAAFGASASSSYLALNPVQVPNSLVNCYHNPVCVKLNTTPNVPGFNERRKSGATAGERILEKIRKGDYQMRIDNKGKVLDKVDIVCHSMGFAYVMGIIDVLKQSDIPLGRFYIIAPENACSGEINLSDFEEVWQYGTNEEALKEQPWLQDGVAPQCGVGGLARERRAYIEDAVNKGEKVPQGFIKSHKIVNYEWIFTREKGSKGYVTPRK